MIERDFNVVNGLTDLQHLHTFSDFPVYMGCTDQPIDTDVSVDMTWWISKSTGIIQLNPLVPEEVLYAQSHGAGSVGRIWQQHHQSFSDFIERLAPKNILEIGGGHGELSRCYQSKHSANWTIIEPNPTPGPDVRANYIKGFFNESFTFDEEFDLIVHSHVFEHLFQPDQFFNHLAIYAMPGKKIAFSLPNMQAMLERYYTNCINFEHTLFLTEPYIEFILTKNGFRITDKEYFMEDHSIFYVAVRDPDTHLVELPRDIAAINRTLFENYVAYYQTLISEINQITTSTSKPVYLFGAHIFSQSLIKFGLDTSRVVYLLDNDVNKHDLRLYGTSLIVKSPKILKDVDSPLVILKAGVYNDEIKRDILTNINPDTEFLE